MPISFCESDVINYVVSIWHIKCKNKQLLNEQSKKLKKTKVKTKRNKKVTDVINELGYNLMRAENALLIVPIRYPQRKKYLAIVEISMPMKCS